MRVPSAVPAAPHQPSTAVGNLPPPSFEFQGLQVQCPRCLLSFLLLQGPSTPEAGPGQGFGLRQGQGLRGRPLPPGPSGDWSEDWGGDWPRECVLSLRPIQYSSFMSRPGLRWRVRWGKDSDSEPEWGKGPVGGSGGGVLCPSWPAGPPREDSPKALAPSSPEEKDAWEVERRGQRGRLPLGL